MASLLTALYTRNLAPHSENPETSRFVGGAQQVSIRTAKALGNRVILNAAVHSLKHSGGAVVALINVLKSYVDRSPELVIDVKTKSGDRIKISSKNVDAAEVKSTLNTILTKG